MSVHIPSLCRRCREDKPCADMARWKAEEDALDEIPDGYWEHGPDSGARPVPFVGWDGTGRVYDQRSADPMEQDRYL